MEDDIIFDSNSLTIIYTIVYHLAVDYVHVHKILPYYITLYTETNTDNIHEVLIQIHKHII